MIAEVIVDIANSQVDRIFDYIIPNTITLSKGSKVMVPFGNRKIEGYVIGIKENSEYDSDKLKEIISVKKGVQISAELIDLCFYLKNKFYLKLIDCIRLCLPTVIRQDKVKHLQVYSIELNSDVADEYIKTLRKNAINQIKIIEYLKQNKKENSVTLNKQFGVSSVNKLLQNNVLIKSGQIVERSPISEISSQIKPNTIKLNQMQQNAVNEIINSNSQTVLLFGVTGSGKTEVYLNVIQNALNNNKTAIMLVPEIGLTPQMVKRFRERFGNLVAVLHSGLSEGEKHDEWMKLYNQKAKVVVGARSAIFAPLNNLGVIIIDEEHDNSYLSESNPRYNTIDVAEFRSKYNNCPLVLGSATPNIESFYKAKKQEYKLVSLPVRVNNLQMPPFEIVDMLPEFRGGNTSAFSSVLIKELQETINNNNQAILFINRRGFASFLMCQDCGYLPNCKHCDFSLVYHKQDKELKCHYCGARYKAVTICPECKSHNLKLGGIGTERVVHDLKEIFPNVPIFRMDNDTTTVKNSHYKILKEFEQAKPGILVGTQMIAKGHDFPNVTLVGILDADLSLYFSSYRSTERTFQLITQVAGRAGRSFNTGKVILQTYFPKHYVYKLVANYNYEGFYEKEINLREVTQFPPFSNLIRILITSPKDEQAKLVTHNLFLSLKDLKVQYKQEIIFLEAMRSPVNKIKGKYRYQIVMRYLHNQKITEQIHAICDTIKQKDLTIFIENNPQNLS